MRNIKLSISYDGTNYCGWQVQKNRGERRSIQGVIEKTLKKILQERVRLIGSGRTDAGVHALGQVANFKTTSTIEAVNIKRALNSLLPQDIKISSASEVDLGFHSQHGAKLKTYQYLILNSRDSNPLLFRYVHQVAFSLDIPLMAAELRLLRGRHNFKSFCASGSKVKSTTRTVKKLALRTSAKFSAWDLMNKARLVIISIEADGFLYNMVRNIVGTLIDIGRGHLKKGDMKRILKAKDRRLAGSTAPAKGLYLCEVKYKK
ncbi:MAG: tRNA pseudouridine(38-40) synthase TruA [Candidatus Omnitrophica bacterium]|nr:tRNA pseudouridine(38-40) synthase TruA [Candidatus Omnitrophota bacterium]